MTLLVVRLLQRYRLEYTGPPVGLALSFTNKPDRVVNIKLIDR